MASIPQRELRNDCSGVLRRAEAGEELEITVDGRPVARLSGIAGRRRFVPVAEFLRMVDAPLRPDPKALRRDVSAGIDHGVRDPHRRRR